MRCEEEGRTRFMNPISKQINIISRIQLRTFYLLAIHEKAERATTNVLIPETEATVLYLYEY